MVVAGFLIFIGCLAYNSLLPEKERATGGERIFGALAVTAVSCTALAILMAVVGIE
jgi:hypothetical protein